MSLSPAERSERARIAANARWAREPDRLAATEVGRRAAFDKILNEVDPHHELGSSSPVNRTSPCATESNFMQQHVVSRLPFSFTGCT
jgi:hypothetical protein